MAAIHRVLAQGAPPSQDDPAEGEALALKLASGDALARDTMAREVETFQLLQAARSAPPCPRLVDVIDEDGQAVGIVMEWCPTDMEQWWDRILVLPDALEPLCGALADICRRIAEYHAIMASKGVSAVHADIKPRNAVLADDGRWLLTDFGAAKSRPIEQETWEATRLILGTENFIAPEMLFNARKHHPQAMDTWSVGASFFALLKMRRHRLFGNELPIDGTHNILFRCQRMSAVTDLRERKPTLFAGKDLDPSAFTSPESLDDDDRLTVSQALLGVFGEPDAQREQQLEHEILALLDRALTIDPALRFTRAEDMSQAFDRIVRRYWELEGSLGASVSTPRAPSDPTENAPMQHDPDMDEGRPTVVAPEHDPHGDEPVLPSPVAPVQVNFPPAGQADEQTVLATPELLEEASGRQGFGAPAAEPPLQASPAASLGPPPGAAPPSDQSPSDTLVPPDPAPTAAEPPAPLLPLAPPPANDRVVQLLEGIHAQLGTQRAPAAASKVKLPFWLVLAIGLLIFCQALQFGLLVAIFLGSMGMSAFELPAMAAPDLAADDAEASPFELTAPVEDGLALASEDPERSGDDDGAGDAEAADDAQDLAEESDEADALEPEGDAVVLAEPAAPVEPEEPTAPAVSATADVYDRNSEPAPQAAPAPAPAKPTQATKPAASSASKPAASSASKPAAPSVSTPSSSGTSSSTRTSKPAPSAEPEPAPAVSGTSSIEVLGATSYVVGTDGRRPSGDLPSGTYEVFAQPTDAGDYISLGVHMLTAGEKMQFRCGFGACRRIQ